jgi:hypothetical protein
MSAAGHLVAVDPLSSKPVANVAFTADGVGPSTRPVLFCNGGRAPAGSYDNWS